MLYSSNGICSCLLPRNLEFFTTIYFFSAYLGYLLDIETELSNLMKEKKNLTKPGTFISDLFGQFSVGKVQHIISKASIYQGY